MRRHSSFMRKHEIFQENQKWKKNISFRNFLDERQNVLETHTIFEEERNTIRTDKFGFFKILS